MVSYLDDEEDKGTGTPDTIHSEYNLAYVIQMLQENGTIKDTITGSGTINGDVVPVSVELNHNFNETTLFPDLKERTNINDIGGGTSSLSVAPEGLDVNFETSVTINMVQSGAGYNNTLGVYTIGDDGSIQAVKFAYTNVKDPLNSIKSELSTLNKEQANLTEVISKAQKTIISVEQKIDDYQEKITKFQDKINDVLAKSKLSKGDENKLDTYQKQIDRYEEQIAEQNEQINDLHSEIDKANERLNEIAAEKETLSSDYSFTYNIDSQYGTELGLFIISDGDRKNDLSGLDLENGTLNFIYHLGQTDERLAKITDTASEISLIYTNGDEKIILKGDIYHSTERGASTNINPDGSEHAVSGLVDASDPSTLRIGFEDLRNLGDADFNDVVFDIRTQTQTVYIPAEYFNDNIQGSDQSDTINAGQGDDIIRAGAGNDTVEGGTGNDIIYGGLGYDLLRGGDGNDEIHGGDWKDVLVGNAGNDQLYGDDGDDTLYGNEGDDELWGGNHNDTLNGNIGNDRLYGEASDDTLLGEAGDDYLDGGLGNDTINGGDGNDTIKGGDGNDRISGDKGNDIIDGGAGNDIIYGNDGNDVINAGDGNDEVIGGLGNDTINTGNGDDRAFGNEGDDIINGGNDKDVLYGNEGHDTISGGGGDDQLIGGLGNDILKGEGGRDYLYGEDGNDFIFLGEGADIAYGGKGADTFVIEETAGRNNDMAFAMDFNVAEGDKIDITDLLSNFNAETDDINDFVFIAQGFNTTIQIDRDGSGTEFGIDNVLRLQGNTTLDTDVQTLIDKGILII